MSALVPILTQRLCSPEIAGQSEVLIKFMLLKGSTAVLANISMLCFVAVHGISRIKVSCVCY